MPFNFDKKLFDTLLDLDLLPGSVLKKVYERSKEEKRDFYTELVAEGLIKDKNLGRITADILGLPFIELSEVTIDPKVLQTLPEDFARAQQVIVFDITDKEFRVATNRPHNPLLLEALKKKTDKQIKIYFASQEDISQALLLYKQDLEAFFKNLLKENINKAKSSKSKTTDEEKAEPPIIKIVDTLINYAHEKKASDIHIEPLDRSSLVRFRIDGMLHDIVSLPLEIHPRIVTRIKVLSKLRTDEHQAAQDGKIEWKVSKNLLGHEEKIDLRVSVVPTTNDEKIVMRLLSEQSRRMSLEDLGLSDKDLEKVKEAYTKPHGMLLSTGPTGSGKTTTLYTLLKLLNTREVNISTIEDPVEYDIEGVTQIQVNPKTELTFAKGLRSIVRQDPDIILVGEIRDTETADIAVNAAMTGHLVLSTLHTNDAATAIPRFTDMKIEPFLIASTINVIIAQRLVRKIHLKCRASVDIDRKVLEKSFSKQVLDEAFGNKQKIRVYKGQGCPVCDNTGYEGRIGLFEVMIVDDEIRQAIIEEKDSASIKKIAVKNGMTTMQRDGLEKVKEGVTSIEEILRVTKEYD